MLGLHEKRSGMICLGRMKRFAATRRGKKSTRHTPFGVVDEDSGRWHITFGSSAKTSDFIRDNLEAYWAHLPPQERAAIDRLQIKADNGPESSGRRTRFFERMVDFCDAIGKLIELLYYPPYHSKYSPLERCWGILEKHWNGAMLADVDTMLGWAKSMTWKGLHPVLTLTHQVYEKGISLFRQAMQSIEARLERPLLPK